VRKPVDGVDDAGGVGCRGPDVETSIVVEAGTYIITSDSVDSEGFTSRGWFMDKDLDARWCKRSFVKVEMAVNLRMG
jgi:hypothetical protein